MAGGSSSTQSSGSSSFSVGRSGQTSPLSQIQHLGGGKAGGSARNSNLAPALQLTSLIDAFAIIVIYLLVGTQNGGADIKIPTSIELPHAETGVPVEESPIVRIEKGIYYIEDIKVATADLANRLHDLKVKTEQKLNADKSSNTSDKKEVQILIQADHTMDYSLLDPLIKASSAAGIQKLKFAVVPQGNNQGNNQAAQSNPVSKK
jgi:biopolymer transport protein ExbD